MTKTAPTQWPKLRIRSFGHCVGADFADVCIYVHTCGHVIVCICIYMYISTSVLTCLRVNMYVHAHEYIFMDMCMCIYMYIYVHMYGQVHVWAYTYISMYINIPLCVCTCAWKHARDIYTCLESLHICLLDETYIRTWHLYYLYVHKMYSISCIWSICM